MKLDHFYVTVSDLDEAISFYERLLGIKIVNREGNRWADFNLGTGIYLGLYNHIIDNEEVSVGTSPTLCIKSDSIEKDWEYVKKISPKSISDIVILEQPALYKYFHFTDPWGNKWEVAEYNY